MNDETLVTLRNLARARSLWKAANDEKWDAHDRAQAADDAETDRLIELRKAEEAFYDVMLSDRGLLAEAVLGTETAHRAAEVGRDLMSDPTRRVSIEEGRAIIGDMIQKDIDRVGPEHQHEFRVENDRIVCDCGFSSGRDGTFQNGIEISPAVSPLVDAIDREVTNARLDRATERMAAKSRSQTCMVGFFEGNDCRKPSGHNGQHTWEVTAEELQEAEQARSSEATADLVAQAFQRAMSVHQRELQDGDPLTDDHHPFIPEERGRCAIWTGIGDGGICGKDPNAPVHLLYAGDGNTRVDYTPTPKGTD